MVNRSRPILAVLYLSILVTITPKSATAQGSDFEEFHTWTDVETIHYFSDHFRYDGDYGIRGLLTDRNWTLIYLRPSVRYRVKPWLLLHGGAALFYNFFQNTEDLPELRPWLGLRLLWRPGGWTVSNYFRLELRAFYLKQESEWDPVLRGRWQLQVTSPRFNIGSMKEFLALASIEPFADLSSGPNTDFFGDRFRFNLGLGKIVKRGLRVELNYLWHIVRLINEDGSLDADDHVVRLRFFYSFN